MKGKFTRIVCGLAVAVGLVFGASGCIEGKQDTREKSSHAQESLMERATAETPVPKINHFVVRKAVAKWLKRNDVPNKLFYVYVMTPMGQPLGYFVSQHYPVSYSALMTPPDTIVNGNWNGNDHVVSAPALDGVWYGGGGATDLWYFFDAETDALISLKGGMMFFTDQPLSLPGYDRIYVKEAE